MRNLVTALALSALILVGIKSTAEAAEGDVAGKVLRLQNAAMAMQDALPRPLKVGSEILVGDVISTGKGTRLEFKLNDGLVMTLGERTVFVVSEFVQTPAQENIALRLLSGAFKASSGAVSAANPDAMTVATNTGTIGIRGTTVWGGTLDSQFEVALLDGKSITVTTRGGQVELTAAGQGTRVPSEDSAPTAPVVWGQAKISRALATVDF
ncbi:MAG: FecR family protein [Rhodospirillales bacterium]